MRVISDSPTVIDFVDDAPSSEEGVKAFDDLFEKEELLKIPPKYEDEDFVVCTIL